MKKIVAGLLAFSLVIGGIYFVTPEASEVKAETTENTTEETAEKIVYTTETYIEDAAGTVQGHITNKDVMDSTDNSGWLFAGWFTDEYCTTPVSTTVEGTTYHAKFVDPGVLDVKLQITEGATPESDSVNMRMVTSVDSLDYAQVGFDVYYNEDIGATEPTKNVPIYKVFERIVAIIESGVDYNYSPKVVDTDSEYFTTATLVGIAKANYEKPFLIKPYWVTYQGVKIYGTSRYVTMTGDAFSTVTTANVPVKIAKADSYTVNGTEGVAAVYHDGEYAHFRVTAPTVSLTKYTVSDGNNSVEAYYRNLETVYNGTNGSYVCGDKTWYTAYADSEGAVSETEFVIATAADLYALPTIVNTDGISFDGKIIYVVADIAGNTNVTISPNSVTGGNPAMTSDTNYRWESIGNATTQFRGIFDGCGHIITGLYINGAPLYCGLFGATDDATITNLRLEDSVFRTSVNGTTAQTGSIVAFGDATITNVYTNATLVGYYYLGGIIGRVDYQTTDTSDDCKVKIENCHYDGLVYNRRAGTNARSGGVIGYALRGNVDISNTLFTGKIRVSKSGTRIGGFIGDTNAANALKTLSISDSISAGQITVVDTTGTHSCIASVIGRTYPSGKIAINRVYSTTECYSVAYAVNGTEVLSFAEGSDANSVTINQNGSLYGLAAHHWTNLDFENDWSIKNDSVPIPKVFADSDYTIAEGATKADTSWYEEGETGYEIKDAADLYGLALLVNDGNTFEGITLTLANDIDLNPDWDGTFKIVDGGPVAPDEPINEWLPIGTANNPFKGNLDGNEKTISGLYIDKRYTDSNGVGLFGNTQNVNDETQKCTISDVAIVNSYIYANNTDYVGGIVGSGEGTISNVYSATGIYGVNNCNNGGIIGFVPHNSSDPYVCTISNCWYDGLLVARTGGAQSDQYVNAGGLVGCTMGGDTTVEHCLFTGTINYKTGYTGNSAYEDSPVWPRIGGLVGRNNGTTSSVAIVDSLSAGTMTLISNGEDATITQVGSIIGSERSTTSASSSNNAAFYISNVYAMSNYNLPVASSKEASGVTMHITSFVNESGEATIVNVVDNWVTGIGELNATYWALDSTSTIPILKTLVGYTDSWAVLP